MRIVGGSHRGRPLIAPPDRTTRPTTDRVREAMFNMLLHSPSLLTDEGKTRLEGGIVIDPFAGSGALAFEALSRGALHAHLFEIDPQARRVILRNAADLGFAGQVTLRGADARHPGKPVEPASLVFMDPPWRSGLGTPVLAALDREGWLRPDALVMIETDAKGSFAIPPGFALLEERQQGPARLTFLLKQPG